MSIEIPHFSIRPIAASLLASALIPVVATLVQRVEPIFVDASGLWRLWLIWLPATLSVLLISGFAWRSSGHSKGLFMGLCVAVTLVALEWAAPIPASTGAPFFVRAAQCAFSGLIMGFFVYRRGFAPVSSA